MIGNGFLRDDVAWGPGGWFPASSRTPSTVAS